MLRIRIGDEIHQVNVTKFPDGTSQVWKLDEKLLNTITESHVLRVLLEFEIIWNFQDDSEIVHLYSLVTLLKNITKGRYKSINLMVPFLPGARQDKVVSNESTFNRQVYCTLINLLNFGKVRVFDCHSKLDGMLNNSVDESPTLFHRHCLQEFSPNYIVFPDEGAYDRYHKEFEDFNLIVMKKTRNQSSGIIEGMEVDFDKSRFYQIFDDEDRFLIVDDICDGGFTFILASQVVCKMHEKAKIALAVSHGIFSKGLKEIEKAGISKIFTANSLVQSSNVSTFNII